MKQQMREQAEMMEESRKHQQRYGKLLDAWENQARRFEAILAKWENSD